MITSIEQTMKDNHTAIRERLGMGVMARPVMPLRIAPARSPDPPKPILAASKPAPLTDIAWRNIISEVMQKHGVTIPELMGSKRKREYIAARREVAWRLLTERGMTYNAIARRMGYLDHSSIINLIEGYEKEHGGTRRNSKEAVAKKRIERNANFIRRLNEGAYVSEIMRWAWVILVLPHYLGCLVGMGGAAKQLRDYLENHHHRGRIRRLTVWLRTISLTRFYHEKTRMEGPMWLHGDTHKYPLWWDNKRPVSC